MRLSLLLVVACLLSLTHTFALEEGQFIYLRGKRAAPVQVEQDPKAEEGGFARMLKQQIQCVMGGNACKKKKARKPQRIPKKGQHVQANKVPKRKRTRRPNYNRGGK